MHQRRQHSHDRRGLRPLPAAASTTSSYDAARWGQLSFRVNVVIVVFVCICALWSFLTASPQFLERVADLFNSYAFRRTQDAFLALPAQNWKALELALERAPFVTASVMTAITYALADWTAQSCEGRGPFGFSRARLLRTTIVGAVFLAPLAHSYYELQDWLLPSAMWAAPLKVIGDQTVYACTYNIIFLAGIGLLRRDTPQSIVHDVKDKLWMIMKSGWKLWPFVHIFTYTIIPTRFKLLWVDIIEVIWVTYLSLVANARRKETQEVVQEVADRQDSGASLAERQRAERALHTLSERCAGLAAAVPELPNVGSQIKVSNDEAGRLTVVQIARTDRPGAALDVLLSFRALSISIVRGVIDTTDRGIFANVFYVQDERTGGMLSVPQCAELERDLQMKLGAKQTERVVALGTSREAALAAAAAEPEEQRPLVEPEARGQEFLDPAAELLHAIEVDKETRVEVGRALQAEGLEVPDTSWCREEDEEENSSTAPQVASVDEAEVLDNLQDILPKTEVLPQASEGRCRSRS